MVNIELTSQQAEELKNFYVIELEKIQKRADEIKGLLTKLNSTTVPIATSTTKQVSEKTHKKITVQNLDEINLHKESEAHSPKWGDFIIQVLQEKQKPLTRKAITKLYEKHYNTNITKSKRSGMEQALARLRVRNKKIQSIQTEGKKERLYGLTEWADKSSLKTKPEKIVKTKKATSMIAIKRDKRLPANTTYNWPQFIIDTLSKTKRVLTAKDFLQRAMVHYTIPKHDIVSTRGKLSPALSNMEKNTKKLKTVMKKGITGRCYGLTEWFDDDGKLIAIYK